MRQLASIATSVMVVLPGLNSWWYPWVVCFFKKRWDIHMTFFLWAVTKLPAISWRVTTTDPTVLEKSVDVFINLFTIHISFFIIIQTLKLYHHDNSYYIQSDDNYYIARKDYFSPIFASSIEPRNWWCQFSTTIQ